MNAINAAAILGISVIGLSLYSIYSMEETFHKDLDYVEIDEKKKKLVDNAIN